MTTFQNQSATWLSSLAVRKRKPVSPATMRSYESRVRRILSIVGPDTTLESFGNASLKSFVAEASTKSSNKRVVDLFGVILQIFKSATNENGEELFPRKWNHEFADMPVVDKTKQKTPCFTKEQVELCIRSAKSYQEQILYVLLAATGLRISEARSILVNSTDEKLTTWNENEATISVRDSMFDNARMDRLKTKSSRRVVNLHSRINQVVAAFVAAEKREPNSYLFQGDDGTPLDEATVRTRLARRAPGGAPHAFRRFRITHLRGAPCEALAEG
jgi:integrase